MTRFAAVSVALLLSGCSGLPFDEQSHYPYEPFGVYKRPEMDGDKLSDVAPTTSRKFVAAPKKVDVDPTNDMEDFEQAEDAIFHAVETAEKAMLHLVEHAIEDEVDTYFHDLPKHEKEAGDAGEKESAVERRRRCMSGDLKACLEEMEMGFIE